MNCVSCLLTGLFLTHAASAPQGAPQAPQGCSPQGLCSLLIAPALGPQDGKGYAAILSIYLPLFRPLNQSLASSSIMDDKNIQGTPARNTAYLYLLLSFIQESLPRHRPAVPVLVPRHVRRPFSVQSRNSNALQLYPSSQPLALPLRLKT